MTSEFPSNGSAGAPHERAARAPTQDPLREKNVAPTAGGAADAAAGSLLTELAATAEFSLHMLAARLDELRLRTSRSIRRAFLAFGLALVTLGLAGVTATISAVYLVQGVAGALAEAAGGRDWVGRLGAGLAGTSLLLGAFAWRELRAARRRRLDVVRKYALRKARQRARFGRDVEGGRS